MLIPLIRLSLPSSRARSGLLIIFLSASLWTAISAAVWWLLRIGG
jgi:hypothetical protein